MDWRVDATAALLALLPESDGSCSTLCVTSNGKQVGRVIAGEAGLEIGVARRGLDRTRRRTWSDV